MKVKIEKIFDPIFGNFWRVSVNDKIIDYVGTYERAEMSAKNYIKWLKEEPKTVVEYEVR